MDNKEKETLYRRVEMRCMTCLGHDHVAKNCFSCHGTKKIIVYEPVTIPSINGIEWRLSESFVKGVLAQYVKEEISFGKMVELFNEKIQSHTLSPKEVRLSDLKNKIISLRNEAHTNGLEEFKNACNQIIVLIENMPLEKGTETNALPIIQEKDREIERLQNNNRVENESWRHERLNFTKQLSQKHIQIQELEEDCIALGNKLYNANQQTHEFKDGIEKLILFSKSEESTIQNTRGIMQIAKSLHSIYKDSPIQSRKEMKDEVDICLREGCNATAQINYRLCPKHLKEAHAEGFDDSNK